MTDPKKMCSKHLLGEHVELHMFVGSMRKKVSMRGYLDKNLLEPLSMDSRHTAIVEELATRGVRHQSPLNTAGVCSYLSSEDCSTMIDVASAKEDLLGRCEKCRKLHLGP